MCLSFLSLSILNVWCNSTTRSTEAMLHLINEQWWYLYHTSKDQVLTNKKKNQLILLEINLNQHWSSISSTKDPYDCHYLRLATYLWPNSNHNYKLLRELLSTIEGFWRAIPQENKSLKCFQPNHRKAQPLCSKDNALKLITQLFFFGNWEKKLSKSRWSLTQSNFSEQSRVNNLYATIKKLSMW